MEARENMKDVKESKKINPVALEIAKTVGYSFLTGLCMAAGSHAYDFVAKPSKGKLISINGGKQSAAV